jgi:hypothetical protein
VATAPTADAKLGLSDSATMTMLEGEIRFAEHKPRQSFEGLIRCLDRPDSVAPDINLHRRMADDLTLVTARHVTLVSKLKSSDWARVSDLGAGDEKGQPVRR